MVKMTETVVKVEIPGRLLVSWDGKNFNAIGDMDLKNSIEQIVEVFGRVPSKWPTDHKSLRQILKNPKWNLILIRFARMASNQWNSPYSHDEICHCRMVPTEKVIAAIEQNCVNVQAIARTTLAGTGCGTCRTDSDKILQYYAG